MAYRDNHADDIPSIAPGENDAQRYASNRAHEALMLAQTPEAWAQLIRGHPVPADQLDPHHLARQRRRTRQTKAA